jgi:hypothetical protein
MYCSPRHEDTNRIPFMFFNTYPCPCVLAGHARHGDELIDLSRLLMKDNYMLESKTMSSWLAEIVQHPDNDTIGKNLFALLLRQSGYNSMLNTVDVSQSGGESWHSDTSIIIGRYIILVEIKCCLYKCAKAYSVKPSIQIGDEILWRICIIFGIPDGFDPSRSDMVDELVYVHVIHRHDLEDAVMLKQDKDQSHKVKGVDYQGRKVSVDIRKTGFVGTKLARTARMCQADLKFLLEGVSV